MKFHRVGVSGMRAIGRYFVLDYPWNSPVEPGQFVMARAAGYPETLDPFLARPLSVYDYDGETVSLLFEVRGRGTALLTDREEIEVSNPIGRSFDSPSPGEQAALLGGGIGIAPFRFLSRRLDELGVPHEAFLGFSDASFSAAAEDFPEARVATMDGSAGTSGTVLDAVEEYGGFHRFSAVYACGPNPMLATVKLSVPSGKRCQVSVEERMGCANGSCNGCVVPTLNRGYVRSCVEGPVFDAEALAW